MKIRECAECPRFFAEERFTGWGLTILCGHPKFTAGHPTLLGRGIHEYDDHSSQRTIGILPPRWCPIRKKPSRKLRVVARLPPKRPRSTSLGLGEGSFMQCMDQFADCEG